jgi:uncharacterized protein with ParB-like and HNH nuclease domain
VFAGEKQFVIPVFQRNYSWGTDELDALWSDVQNLLEADSLSEEHFIGTFVVMPGNHRPGTVPEYLVIDGQQRLITLTLFLSAIRDYAAEVNDERHNSFAEEINKKYLIDEFKDGVEKFKVISRAEDRDALFTIVEQESVDENLAETSIYQSYDFLYSKIEEVSGDDEIETLDRLKQIIIQQLPLVMITTSEDENPYAIFETLNERGLQLEESDLIRNHVFMQLSLTEQDRFNDEHWMPFEQKFEETDDYSGVDLTEFYRDYMMRTGEYVQKNEIYHQFKRRTSEMTPRELVDELSYYGDLYLWIQRPETAPNEELTNALRRLQYLEIGTAHQLVLNLLYRWDSDDLSIDELLETLHGLESFVLRRFICGRSTRGYYRTFPIAARSIEDDDVKGSLFAYLKSQGWPDDTELLDNILRFDMYNRDKKKTWLVLRTLEEQFGHREPVQYDELTIEHVMPQTIDDNEWGDEWKAMLGDEWERIHDQWLHALGNLTLSGYNPELSNRPFDEKRELLMESHVELNGYFEECDNWTEKTIRERNQELAERLASIWRVPQVDD